MLTTNSIRKSIDGEDTSPLCRMCGERKKPFSHIVTECMKLTQKECKGWRHDQVGKCVHRRLCQKFGSGCRNWYDHEPKPVEESEECKLLWDIPIMIETGHKIEHNRPDIVAVDKKERSCTIINNYY